jgi:hypothetical protein
VVNYTHDTGISRNLGWKKRQACLSTANEKHVIARASANTVDADNGTTR